MRSPALGVRGVGLYYGGKLRITVIMRNIEEGDGMVWQKELVRADLIWVLLQRAGILVEWRDESWQWAIGPLPEETDNTPSGKTWHGAFDTPNDALQDALYALIAHYKEQELEQ